MSLLTCNQFLDELSEYLDETAQGEVRKELEAHVSECPNCWVMVDTTKKTLAIYKGLEAEPLSNGLRDRLMGALEKKMAGQAGE
ncbi:MAG TPA: zf-HC2 domain-containing protein [Bryobacteraceae bacterium]|nr:zf-HC2 domain-containing protein [Bryobacteraceae bacterium]